MTNMRRGMQANRAGERAGEASMCARRATAPGFSLLEMLVVIAVIAILLAIMLPALSASRRAGRNLKCASHLKQVSFEFQLFADDFAVRTRGNSAALGPKLFYIEDFQESLYRVDEFWDAPDISRMTFDPSQEIMMCPEGPSFLRRLAATPCSAGAIFPRRNVSTAFNRRLHRAMDPGGPAMQIQVLTSRVLDHPNAPLAMDIDASQTDPISGQPYYAAPPWDSADGYEGGGYWFPSFRHGRRMNVAMVGGHVASIQSGQPLSQTGMEWGYVPD